MKKIYFAIFVALTAISTVAAFKQMDFSKIDLVTQKVAGTVYAISDKNPAVFSGGNIGFSVGEDGVVMVDAKYAPLGDKIKAAIKSVGGDLPSFIINTHVHADHVAGNSEFSAHSTVITHTNIRKRLADKPKEQWAVITFDESLSIHMNGEEIKAIHYPKGHTDGDAIVYFTGSNVVHMGDHLFNKMFPYVDLNSGGTVQGFMENTKKTLDEVPDDVKIIAGHGALATKADLAENYRMLQETVALVTEKMKAGKTVEQIVAEGLPAEWDSWSWAFITTKVWIETIYNSYAG